MVAVQMQSGSATFGQRHFRSYKVTCVFFAHNFLQKRDEAIQIASVCSAGQDETDMYNDLRQWPVDLQASWPGHLRSKFDREGSTNTFFDTSRREKHDGARIICSSVFRSQKKTTKNHIIEIVDLASEVNSNWLRVKEMYHRLRLVTGNSPAFSAEL